MDFEYLKTQDPEMTKQMLMAAHVAPNKAAFLMRGQNGVGKSLMARFIHGKANGIPDNFITLRHGRLFEDLTSISPEVIKSGTLHLPQAHRLQVQEQIFLSDWLKNNNVRFISTTEIDLKEMVRNSRFDEKLYHRLAVVYLEIPALRERICDLFLLADFFVRMFSITHNKRIVSMSDQAKNKLMSWPWHGNLFELETVIERAVLLSQGLHLEADDIMLEGPSIQPGAMAYSPGTSLAEMEKSLIMQTLRYTDNNRTKAADLLGISIRTLRNKLNEYKREVEI